MGFNATVDAASSVLMIYPLREEEGWKRFSFLDYLGSGFLRSRSNQPPAGSWMFEAQPRLR